MGWSLLFHTIKHLQLKQIYYQFKYRLNKAKFQIVDAPPVRELKTLPWINKVSSFNGDTFCFLNISDEFHSWNDTRHGMLWAYNLNYMDWLLQNGILVNEGTKWINKFIAEISTNSVGLDPYPIALRGINWIKFMSKHGSNDKWNDLLYSQYVLLTKKLEYHLLGNHLLEDAFSLYIAAIYFRDDKFYAIASKLLRQELDEQILPDGAHYEQSPMYHCILLDRLLDCCNFSFNNIVFDNQESLNTILRAKSIMMLGHLENICYNDAVIPLLNDSAIGIAPTSIELKDYAARLGLQWYPIEMKECGYRMMSNGDFEAIVDIGNITATYQPGHSHADTFNYELRIDCMPFVVDTGISTYNKTMRRQEERGTAAHNTVVVDSRNSSEVWGGFRMGRRARVRIIEDVRNKIVVEHNGFGKKCLHYRKFTLTENVFEIEDTLSQACNAISYIHLAPSVKVISNNDNEVVTDSGMIQIRGAKIVEIDDCEVSEQYNIFKSTKVIKIHFDNNVSYSISK